MKETKFNSQSGKSLIEILIILVVTIVLVTFAVARFGSSKTQLQRQNIAREFKVDLERARFDSVKRRATTESDMSRVTIDSATSFTVATDFNQDGTLGTNETRQADFSSQTDMRILSDSSNFPIYIRFDRRGHATTTDKDGAAVSAIFTVCNDNCNALTEKTASNSSIVSISPTGTVAMVAGGESQTSFQPPANLTNTSSLTNINPRVSIKPSNYPSY